MCCGAISHPRTWIPSRTVAQGSLGWGVLLRLDLPAKIVLVKGLLDVGA